MRSSDENESEEEEEESSELQRGGPLEFLEYRKEGLEIGIKFIVSVVSINDVEQSWRARCAVFLHFPYCNPAVEPNDVEKHPAWKRIEKPENFTPSLLIIGEIANEMTNEMYWLHTPSNSVYACLEFDTIVKEKLEMDRFPFDRQILKYILWNCGDDKLVPWYMDEWPAFMPPQLKEHHCGVINRCDDWDMDNGQNVGISEGGEFFSANIYMQRRASYFGINILFPTYIIGQAAALVVGCDPSDFSSHFGILSTLLLTIVAFRFVLMSMMPKLGYITLMDWYVSTGYFAMAGWLIESFFVSYYTYQYDVKTMDTICAFLFSAVWTGMHLLIVIGGFYGWFRLSWEKVVVADAEEDDSKIILL